jgi:hypothetical protein
MTLFGFLASIARHPYDELFATTAMFCYLYALNGINTAFSMAIDGETNCAFSVDSLKSIRSLTYFSWNWITAAWYLVRG